MDSDSIETGGGPFIAGNVHTGGGTFIGRDQNIIKIESHYYVSGTTEHHAPLPLHSILDEPDDDLPLLSAGRAEELAKLNAWYEAVITDKTGEQPRLFVITGQRDIGKRELLQHWRSMLLQRTPMPTVAVTGYLPGYIGKEEQEFYYSDHPGWRVAWAQFAVLLRTRYRYTEALGGLAWIALAAQIVDQSKSAKAQLNRSIPSVGDMDARAIQRQMNDLLLAAVDDGPLVLILEQVDEAQFTVLQPLLQIWCNVMHNVSFLLVLTVNTPAPLHSQMSQRQENDWLTWLSAQTAPHNAYSTRYLHLVPLTVNGVRQLLTTDSEAFAADLHHVTNGIPSLLKELLHHWQQQGEADYQTDGRWRLHPEAFTVMPGTLYQRYIVEPLQDCAAYAQEQGYEITWETLLDWLQYAVWEGEVFTDEALAYAVDMHGEQLETFQEILDEVLVRREDGEQARGLLVELEETVVLPTAELERAERHMALYRFEPLLLARILYHRQHGQERQQRGERYIEALQVAYQPFAQRIAPRLQQICLDLGRAKEAEQFLRLIAPLEEIMEVQTTLAAMRALAETIPLAQQQLVRYTLKFVEHAHGRVHPRPLLPMLEKALEFARKLKQEKPESQLLNHIGWCYYDLGEWQQALAYYEQALTLLRAVGDPAGEAAILNNIGIVYTVLREWQQALAYYEQALTLRRAVGDRAGEAITLSNIGAVYADLGKQQQALAYYEQALTLRRAVGDRAGEAVTLNNIGTVYAYLGEQQQALAYYERALMLLRAVGDRTGEAATLNSIGAVYTDLGEQQQALAYREQALSLFEELKSPNTNNV